MIERKLFDSEDQRTWSKNEAALYLGLSPHTLDQDVTSKTLGIPYLRVGRLRRYRKVDLDDWLESRVVRGSVL